MNRCRKIYFASTVAGLITCSTFTSFAAPPSYPVRPVRVIVPYSPGGSSDAVARILSQKLGETLGKFGRIDGGAYFGIEFRCDGVRSRPRRR